MACFPGGKKVIQTPFVIEATSTSTTLGAWGYNDEMSGGPDAAMLGDIVNQVLGNLSATFLITARPTCRSVPADCDVPIGEGNVRVFWGGATPEFVLGTPESAEYTDPVTNDLLQYEHQGGSGTAVYPYKFFFQRTDNPPENLLEQQYLDLYCQSDNNVSPPVTAWYVVHETFKYCDGFTWDKWAGTIDTYGAPEDCGNISAGDPVPIGEPTMERIGGYPLLSSGGCDNPAPRIRFELEAPCGG
jgi:hypothetical protein